jgi:hypothetical protein
LFNTLTPLVGDRVGVPPAREFDPSYSASERNRGGLQSAAKGMLCANLASGAGCPWGKDVSTSTADCEGSGRRLTRIEAVLRGMTIIRGDWLRGWRPAMLTQDGSLAARWDEMNRTNV